MTEREPGTPSSHAAPSPELSRELSLFHITMMGLGMMIGAGVFLGIGNSIRHAGPGGVLLTFALNGLVALFTAMSYAELSSAIPRAGGAYNFARLAFGKGPSFVAGWMEWFASSVAGSLYAVTFGIYTIRYLQIILGAEWGPATTVFVERIVAVCAALFFIAINYRGASATGRVGAVFTLGQTIFLAFLGVIGVFVAIRDPSRLSNFDPFLPHGWSKLLVTMGFTYVAFEGYEVIAQAGDEAIEPRKNLPKAMLYSVFIVTFTYVATAFATVVAVEGHPDLRVNGEIVAPWEWIGHHGERGFGEAVAHLMPMANFLLTLAVIFASTSALNATVYSATRASYALGRDRMLPPFFARISPRRRTPSAALAFTAIIVILVVTCLPTMDVASSASIMFLLLFFVVNLCVIRIRRNMADELTYGFLMPLFPLFPLTAIVLQAVLAAWLIHMSLIAWIVAPAWIGGGVAIYLLYSRSRAVTTADEIQVIEEEEAPAGDGPRVMVAVANPANAISLAQTTYRICGAKHARVELIHMVPVPDIVPLRDAGSHGWESREAIVEAMLYLAPHFPVSTTLRYCRNVARGIVSATREKKVDLLVMGWHGRTRTRGFSIGSTVDPVIERAPCDVLILKDCGKGRFGRVLAPLAGGPHSGLALEIACTLADRDAGEVVAFTVESGRSAFDVSAFLDERRDRLAIPSERLKARTIRSDDIVQAILAEAADYDLIVLGCTGQPWTVQFAVASVPETVARLCDKPLVMVRAAIGFRSWIRRWI
ncbi:MAG: amino acid permease [Planctomycetes bacterium]|nr:amino acid permease [Planctomycetota bacterium]